LPYSHDAAALAEELKSAADRGEPDDGSRYYEHWLAALERLVTAKGLSDPAAILARKEAWASRAKVQIGKNGVADAALEVEAQGELQVAFAAS